MINAKELLHGQKTKTRLLPLSLLLILILSLTACTGQISIEKEDSERIDKMDKIGCFDTSSENYNNWTLCGDDADIDAITDEEVKNIWEQRMEQKKEK